MECGKQGSRFSPILLFINRARLAGHQTKTLALSTILLMT